ncbi:hypothetical protein BT69DRAFT_1328075 [Atractiella rhizophila]|nr:hypothetical protein BT69DRAFT_1328075 [Atractiella rhizophila]
MTEQETSTLLQSAQGLDRPDLIALAHLITPVRLKRGTPIHLSILSSFLTCLPPSVHMLRITFVLPLRFWTSAYGPSKLSYFSLERLENALESDGTVNLCITLEENTVALTFGNPQHHESVDDLPTKPFTCTFDLLPGNHSQVIFSPIASYSNYEQCFVPVSVSEPVTPSHRLGTIIQLSLTSTPTQRNTPCTISQLPAELLSLIFESIAFRKYERPDYGDVDDKVLESFNRVSAVCQLWKTISVPYWNVPRSIEKKLARLKLYPDAGRLWRTHEFAEASSVAMVKRLLAGSPNLTCVEIDAFWDEEEAKIALNAIQGLKNLEVVSFGPKGARKWTNGEVETFMLEMGSRIRHFSVCEVVDQSPASSTLSASAGLQLFPGLVSLMLQRYPLFSPLSFPHTLLDLTLSHMCPLPPSISSTPLPPLLNRLDLSLAPYGKTSVLSTPLDLSHLSNLTLLLLDGGGETSNLVSPQLFRTLRNAKSIEVIDVRCCVVEWLGFPQYIRWFFGDRGKMDVDAEQNVADKKIQTREVMLRVLLFFGEWRKEDISVARKTMREAAVTSWSWVRECGDLEE